MISKGQLMAFLGVLNGMIGGTILVLPLMGIETGYALIPVIALLYGSFSYYSCRLIILHLGECNNIRDAILAHFNNSHTATVIYNFIIGASLMGLLINYFMLIIKQLQGFFDVTRPIGIGVAAVLVLLTILMRYCHFGQKLLSIGILSVIAYLGFLTWAHTTAPEGPNKIPATGSGFADLAAALTMGYSVHDFVVQILLKTTTHDKFQGVVKMVFFAGTLIYTFISFGAYSIVNRTPRDDDPQTMEEYFPKEGWQVRMIEVLYAFHMLTASPQFCIIMRIRFLQMCKIEDKRKISIPEVVIYICAYGACYALWASGLRIATIIQLNGTVIGFMYIFAIPIVVHIKCVYFSKHDEKGALLTESADENGNIVMLEGQKKLCNYVPGSKFSKTLQLVLQIAILIIGAASISYTLYNLFKPEQSELSL